ncbi:MAG: hypothetical protein ACRC8S_15415 [Fimbriiglobus sp.]
MAKMILKSATFFPRFLIALATVILGVLTWMQLSEPKTSFGGEMSGRRPGFHVYTTDLGSPLLLQISTQISSLPEISTPIQYPLVLSILLFVLFTPISVANILPYFRRAAGYRTRSVTFVLATSSLITMYYAGTISRDVDSAEMIQFKAEKYKDYRGKEYPYILTPRVSWDYYTISTATVLALSIPVMASSAYLYQKLTARLL